MSSPTQTQIFPPDLYQLLVQHARQIGLSLNSHQIGVIQSFDPTLQTVDVKLVVQRLDIVPDVNGNQVPKGVDYVTLLGVPLYILTGGAAVITMPIQVGDECIVAFNDRDIDNWWSGIIGIPPNSPRIHHMSDAIAFVGLHNKTRVVSGYSTTQIQVRGIGGGLVAVDDKVLVKGNGNGRVLYDDKVTATSNAGSNVVLDSNVTSTSVGGARVQLTDKVVINNNADNLKSVLDGLCDLLTAFKDTHGDTPNSDTLTAITALKARIDSLLG